MILVVNVCRERLHYYEFVRPIEDILSSSDFNFFTRYYSDIKKEDVEKCNSVIICGTSLRDTEFVKDINKFSWLRNFKKPVFGICAGFQILGLIFDGKLKRKLEIGFFKEKFRKEFFGIEGEAEVYHLHNNYVELGSDWNIVSPVGDGSGNLAEDEVSQAAEMRNFFGVLFHPEVRQKDMITKFAELYR